MWTPFIMDVILHHHTRWCRYEGDGAPIYPETVERLIDQGILFKTGDDRLFATTERGAALVKAWMETPLPEMRWVDPRFEEKRDAN